MRKELQRLHALGFGILLLKERQKAPIGSGWTKGPRKTLEELKRDYVLGNNIGVRLGEASKIGEQFLACIDLDIKDPKFRGVAEAALSDITKGAQFPEVRSGGGNGSRHLYCLTDTPFKMITVEKHEKWELCIYSTGRQMVLPPSIHPSGKPYIWLHPVKAASDLPTLDVSGFVSKTKERESAAPVGDFKAVDVALDFEGLSGRILNMIRAGVGVEDRSAALLGAALAMCGAGMSDDQILSVLTDKKNFLGNVAYDHRKTNSRREAAAWLSEYTLKKARHETSAARDFEEMVEVAPLDDEAAGAQWAEMTGEIKELEERNGFYTETEKGKLSPCYPLLLAAFEEDHPYKTIADMKAVYTFNGTHYVDSTPIEIKGYAERKFSPKPSEKMRGEFLNKVMANNVTRRSFFIQSTEGRFNFKNGVLDLNKPEAGLAGHSPDFGFRGVLPYDYDEFAMAPRFEEWLHSIMLGDKELVAILQEFMGYVVRGGEYKYHKALWLGGAGRNGKSTFVDVLKALIGIGNYSVLSIKALMNDRFAGSELDGKIANFSEETSPQELADSGPFKNLTGNGDIHAQKKFGDLYSFRNRAKVIMTYNQIPDLKDLSRGMLSRPLIIPFDKTIKEHEQDRNIQHKLMKELPGIFNFALEGWQRLEEQGDFTYSKRSHLALQKVKEESCNVFQWVENNVEAIEGNPNDPDVTFKPKELYLRYQTDEKFAFKMVEFCRRLKAHPLMQKHWKKTREGNVYFGLKLV